MDTLWGVLDVGFFTYGPGERWVNWGRWYLIGEGDIFIQRQEEEAAPFVL